MAEAASGGAVERHTYSDEEMRLCSSTMAKGQHSCRHPRSARMVTGRGALLASGSQQPAAAGVTATLAPPFHSRSRIRTAMRAASSSMTAPGSRQSVSALADWAVAARLICSRSDFAPAALPTATAGCSRLATRTGHPTTSVRIRIAGTRRLQMSSGYALGTAAASQPVPLVQTGGVGWRGPLLRTGGRKAARRPVGWLGWGKEVRLDGRWLQRWQRAACGRGHDDQVRPRDSRRRQQRPTAAALQCSVCSQRGSDEMRRRH